MLPKNNLISKNTLLKINNIYADSYNLILKENQRLTQEIENLKKTVIINKSLVDYVISSHQTSSSSLGNYDTNYDNDLSDSSFIIQKLKEEVSILNESLEKINKDYLSIYSEMVILKNTSFQEIENFKEKINLLEETLFIKENKIVYLENRLKEKSVKTSKSEEYIINPNKTILFLNNENISLKSTIKDLVENSRRLKEKNYILIANNENLNKEYEVLKEKFIRKMKFLEEYNKKEKYMPQNIQNLTLNEFVLNTKYKNLFFNENEPVRNKRLYKSNKNVLSNQTERIRSKSTNDLNILKPIIFQSKSNKLLIKNYKNKEHSKGTIVFESFLSYGVYFLNEILYENGLTYKDYLNLKTYSQFQQVVNLIDIFVLQIDKLSKDKKNLIISNNKLRKDVYLVNEKLNSFNKSPFLTKDNLTPGINNLIYNQDESISFINQINFDTIYNIDEEF